MGKTFIAKAIAYESGAYFLNINPSQVIASFVGETQKNIETIFVQARMHSPCIIFIDEIDSLGTKRGGDQDAHNAVNRQAVNQFLLEMDGLERGLDNIFVISATNRIWEIDPALRRGKRLGDAKYVPLPNNKERKQMVEYYINKAKKASGNDEKEEPKIKKSFNIFWLVLGLSLMLFSLLIIISAANHQNISLSYISFIPASIGTIITIYSHQKPKFIKNKKLTKGIIVLVNTDRINRCLINYSPADIDSIIDKSLIALTKREDKTLYTKDIINVIKSYQSSTQNWFDSTYKELRGRPVYDYTPSSGLGGGSERKIIDYEGGKLSPEELAEYAEMVADIKKNVDPQRKLWNKVNRLFAIYIG